VSIPETANSFKEDSGWPASASMEEGLGAA
jgi:hypothetical protein